MAERQEISFRIGPRDRRHDRLLVEAIGQRSYLASVTVRGSGPPGTAAGAASPGSGRTTGATAGTVPGAASPRTTTTRSREPPGATAARQSAARLPTAGPATSRLPAAGLPTTPPGTFASLRPWLLGKTSGLAVWLEQLQPQLVGVGDRRGCHRLAHRGVTSQPVYYDYGTTLYYEGDNVYYNNEVIATTDEYAAQAQTISANVPEVDPETIDWMPLGVFALTQKDGSVEDATLFLQLAISKDGIIAGTFQNTATENSFEVEGTIDNESQRAAWAPVGESWPVMETGVYNLTENEAGPAIALCRWPDAAVVNGPARRAQRRRRKPLVLSWQPTDAQVSIDSPRKL